MPYEGPLSGALNFILPQAGTTTPAPTVDDGSDGDFLLDLNTAILYGPKDGSNAFSYYWPYASRVWQGLKWRGTWGFPAVYLPGDVVSYNGDQYLCVRTQVIFNSTVNSSSTGNWYPGDTVYDTTNGTLWICYNDTTSPPSALGLAALGYWLPCTPADDWAYYAFLKYNILGSWIQLGDLAADTTVGSDNLTRFVLRSGVVTSGKIATSAVTDAKIATDAVTETKIAANAVTSGKIASSAVTDAKVASGISPSKITGTAVVTSDSRLSDDRTPTMAYTYVNSNPLFLTYYNLTLTNRFVEIAEVTNISIINFPTTAPAQGTMWMVRNARSSVSLTVNAMSGGYIVSSGGSVASVTIAPTETAIFVYAGGSNYIRVETEPAAVINNTRFLQVTPSSNGTVFEVRNAAATPVLAVNTTTTTISTKQYLEHAAYLDTTGVFTVKASDASTVFSVDTSPKQATVNGLATINGSLSVPYRAISSARTLDTTDHTVNCTSGTFDVTLPTATSIAGRVYVVKNSGTGTVTVKTTSSQTIDGQTSFVLNQQYQSLTVQSTGSGWVIL